MNSYNKLIILAVNMFIATGCDSELPAIKNDNEGPISAMIVGTIKNVPETRVSDTDFETGDYIGVYCSDCVEDNGLSAEDPMNVYVNRKFEYNGSDISNGPQKGWFIPSGMDNNIFYLTDKTYNFSAYYPYTENITNGILQIDLSAEGAQTNESNLDFLYASGATGNKTNPNISFTEANAFKHIMSKLRVKFSFQKMKQNDDGSYDSADLDGFTQEELDKIINAQNDNQNIASIDGLYLSGAFNLIDGSVSFQGEKCEKDFFSWTGTSNCTNNALDNEFIYWFDVIILPQQTDLVFKFYAPGVGHFETQSNSINLEAGKKNIITVLIKKHNATIVAPEISDWNAGSSLSFITE